MLLPLPAAQVRRISLKNHLVLAVLRDGRGTIEQLATLLNVVFGAYFLRHCPPDDITPYTDAEAALNRCIRRAERGEPPTPDAGEATLLEHLTAIHDAQLASVPRTAISARGNSFSAYPRGASLGLFLPRRMPKATMLFERRLEFQHVAAGP